MNDVKVLLEVLWEGLVDVVELELNVVGQPCSRREKFV